VFNVLGNSAVDSTQIENARLVCTSDGATTTIYINGEASATGTVGTNTEVYDGYIVIGRSYDSSLSNFRIWDRCLTAAEARIA